MSHPEKADLPLVSIAVCTYNGEKHLHEQLDSLVNQTYPLTEIIVTDDCSSDRTVDILQEYQEKYPFFTYFINEKNLGYVKNFEKAISLCKGAYIALSDQDDIWELNKIEQQVKHLAGHALIYHDSSCIDGEGNLLPKKLSDVYTLYEGKQPHPFLFYNCVSGHSILFDSKILPDLFPFDKDYFHDRWIAFIASERGGIKLLKAPLVKYRQHGSATTDMFRIKNIPEKDPGRFFNPSLIKWVQKCLDKSVYRKGYFQAFLSCFASGPILIRKTKLFFLLLGKRDLIFFTIKKSKLSRINYLRKICFSAKHA